LRGVLRVSLSGWGVAGYSIGEGLVPEELLDCGVNPAVWEVSGHMVLKRAQVRGVLRHAGGVGRWLREGRGALWRSAGGVAACVVCTWYSSALK
jgi:hypothetical protein